MVFHNLLTNQVWSWHRLYGPRQSRAAGSGNLQSVNSPRVACCTISQYVRMNKRDGFGKCAVDCRPLGHPATISRHRARTEKRLHQPVWTSAFRAPLSPFQGSIAMSPSSWQHSTHSIKAAQSTTCLEKSVSSLEINRRTLSMKEIKHPISTTSLPVVVPILFLSFAKTTRRNATSFLFQPQRNTLFLLAQP